MKAYIDEHHPDINLIMPHLSVHPEQAFKQICDLYEQHQPIGVVGSSLGGFYSTAVHAKYNCPAVLINPSVSPSKRLKEYLGENTYWHSGEKFEFTQADIDALERTESHEDMDPKKIWLLVQTHDETLDFKEATQRFYRSRSTIEYGGDHAFVRFERYLPAIVQHLLSYK